MKKQFVVLCILFIAIRANAGILNVPLNFPTIQQAINSSVSGDTIIVQPGTYYENLNFRGRNVVLTSLYYLSRDTSYITSTIINGSNPVNPDTASCVVFNSGETVAAVLQGFTLKGGAGTKWTDIHIGGIYREGGGILIELSSPSILHNLIINNIVTNTAGVISTGGGGLRIGDGNPIVENNVIAFNQGRYGAGIVLNYSGGRIWNNIIANNSGGQEYYGGSGIWIYGNLGTTPKQILNNTIVNNSSSLASGTGGISVWSAINVVIKNNIIRSNWPSQQIISVSSNTSVTYSDIQNNYVGVGNIDADPLFDANCYSLSGSSPCIDAGDTAAIYNDLPLFPSQGTLRNDMGAEGGPYASVLNCISTFTGIQDFEVKGGDVSVFPNPSNGSFTVRAKSFTEAKLEVFDAVGKLIYSTSSFNKQKEIMLNNLKKGIYCLKLTDRRNSQTEKLRIN